jgi:uncharacterized protein (TIGR03435 family)
MAGFRRFLPAFAWLASLSVHAQTPIGRPAFEVATIRLDADCTNGRGVEQSSPGRMNLKCVSIRDVVRIAWGNVGDPNPRRLPDVYGGPPWLDTDFYDIIAKAPGNAGMDEMYGPMTKGLLEDRFHLQLHDEIRQLEVYDLTVAKREKLVSTREGSCVPVDLKTVLQSPPPSNYCGRNKTSKGVTTVFDGYGITLAEFVNRALRTLDRPVIDLTGLKGRFDIHLTFVPPDLSSTGDAGPSIFTALQGQLGLKLSPARGPVEVHVIDHIERPSEN